MKEYKINSENSENSDSKDIALDSLLKKNAYNDRLEALKKKIPIPKELPKKNYGRIVALSLATCLILILIWYFFPKPNSPIQLAENMIHSTVIVSMDEINSRGEESTTTDTTYAKYLKAIELLKNDQEQDALTVFTELSLSYSAYQLEAMWFRALSYIKIGNNKKAKEELEKLKATSSYQHENVMLLLKTLNEDKF